MIKNILQVLAGLAVTGGIFLLTLKGSNVVLLLFAGLVMGVAVLAVLAIRRGIVTGELPGRWGSTYRRASPGGFWFQIGFYAVVAITLFSWGLGLLGLMPEWFLAMIRTMQSHR